MNLMRLLLLHIALALPFTRTPAAQLFLADTGKASVTQAALDLRGDLHLLSLSLRPGEEDLATLAYFRLARGATVVSAYVTNGEAGESDRNGMYAHQLAALRRTEAARAVAAIGGQVRFLNLPDIAAAADTARVRHIWNADTLRARLKDLVRKSQPDIVLLGQEAEAGPENPVAAVLLAELRAAVKELAAAKTWQTGRVCAEGAGAGATRLPLDAVNALWGQTYLQIGSKAGEVFESIRIQRRIREEMRGRTYRVIESAADSGIGSIDKGLPLPASGRLRMLEMNMRSLSGELLRGKRSLRSFLTRIAAVQDKVESFFLRGIALLPPERRRLIDWKSSLEKLRNRALGVTVRYALTEKVLAEVQLTYFTIDSLSGLTAGGVTEVYFPAAERGQGWIVNESRNAKFPLKLHVPYRLLSPKEVVYDAPADDYGLLRPELSTPLIVFIIHKAKKLEESFMERVKLDITFAPRFVTEVLTPIVRVAPGELLGVRLTNHSRDGVTDRLEIRDSLLEPVSVQFRLSSKESTQSDTLWLRWREPITKGTHLIPLKIAGFRVGNFAARKFDAAADTGRRVGVLTGIETSPLMDALRRLGITQRQRLNPRAGLTDQFRSCDVVIIDRRAWTLADGIRNARGPLREFVRSGGHLVILAQDAAAWKGDPLWEEIGLQATGALEETDAVRADSTSPLLQGPNRLRGMDFDGWLTRRAYNLISTGSGSQVPIRTASGGTPLLVTARVEKGRITYCDLALDQQILNIHPGTYRLLGNLISFKD